MSQIDILAKKVIGKEKELIRLSSDLAKETKRESDVLVKIQRAKGIATKTKSEGMLKSKLNEIKRLEDQRARISKKIVKIREKINRKQNEINTSKIRLRKEEQRNEEKQLNEYNRNRIDNKETIDGLKSTIYNQGSDIIALREELNEIKTLPEKAIVLFMASNPIDQSKLRLDEEARSINEMIKKAKHRDSIELVTCWAVRALDLLEALNEHNPSIVHFSGHGSKFGELVFQDDRGKTKLITKEAIVQTMMTASSNLKLVFFNTCYSFKQAEAVTQYIQAAIGMSESIGDKAARIFASQFYSGLGFGLSIKHAFQQAKASLMLEGIPQENIPRLFANDLVDLMKVHIVAPSNNEKG